MLCLAIHFFEVVIAVHFTAPHLTAQQRYAVLQQMGTKLWVPRYTLAGAAPSSVCNWELPAPLPSKKLAVIQELTAAHTHDAHTTLPTTTPVATSSDAANSTPQSLTPSALKLTQQHNNLTTAQPIAASTTVEQELVPEAAPLTAEVWLLANGWQLVMETPQRLTPLQAQNRINLLHGLLRAFYPHNLGILSQETFTWPLAGIPLEVGNSGELARSLQAFLTGARFHKVQLAGCLVFGPRLTKLLTEENPQLGYFGAPSLEAMLREPKLKQDFWHTAGAQGLRASFASSPLVF